MHIAIISCVLVVVPVASLGVLNAWLFVSLSIVSTGQRGVAAANDRSAENEHYQSGFHDPSPFPQVPGPSWLSADYGDHAESRLNGLNVVKQMITVEIVLAPESENASLAVILLGGVCFSVGLRALTRLVCSDIGNFSLKLNVVIRIDAGEPEVWARIRLHKSRYGQMYYLADA